VEILEAAAQSIHPTGVWSAKLPLQGSCYDIPLDIGVAMLLGWDIPACQGSSCLCMLVMQYFSRYLRCNFCCICHRSDSR
jgi:hypothetical protein